MFLLKIFHPWAAARAPWLSSLGKSVVSELKKSMILSYDTLRATVVWDKVRKVNESIVYPRVNKSQWHFKMAVKTKSPFESSARRIRPMFSYRGGLFTGSRRTLEMIPNHRISGLVNALYQKIFKRDYSRWCGHQEKMNYWMKGLEGNSRQPSIFIHGGEVRRNASHLT